MVQHATSKRQIGPLLDPLGRPGIVNHQAAAGRALLAQSLAWWDARQHDGGGWWRNLGRLGEVADLRLGSLSSAAAEIRSGRGANFLRLTGNVGNNAVTPDSAANSVTSDIDLIARLALDKWVSGTNPRIVSKEAGAAFSAYSFAVDATGHPVIGIATDGVGGTTFTTCSVAVPFADGQAGWLRATWRASDGRVQFFSSPDGLVPVWSQLGSNASLGFSVIFDAPMELEIGGANFANNNLLSGRIYRVQVWSGFSDAGGTLRNDFDPSRAAAGATSFVAATGETWTLNRTPGANAAAPQWLPHVGVTTAVQPGNASNYPSTPDSVATSVLGDFDLIVRAALDDWTPGSSQCFFAKWVDSGNQRSFAFRVNSSGTLFLTVSTDGTTIVTVSSSVVLGSLGVDGQPLWVRVNYRASDGRVQFFTSGSSGLPSSWTQLGTNQTAAAVPSIFNSTAELSVGAFNVGATEPASGRFYRAQLWSGFSDAGGTLVADYDPSRSVDPHLTFVAATGETWTHNRSATGRKLVAVDRSLFLFGTDDYMTTAGDVVAMNPRTAGVATMMVVTRVYGTSASYRAVFSKRQFVTAGWEIGIPAVSSLAAFVWQGLSGTSAPSNADSVINVGFRASSSVLSGRAAAGNQPYFGAAASGIPSDTSALGDINVPGNTVLVGARQTGLQDPLDGEVTGVVYWDRAMTVEQLRAVMAALSVPV